MLRLARIAPLLALVHFAALTPAAETADPGSAHPYVRVVNSTVGSRGVFDPASGGAPGGGFGPAQLQHAYGFDLITFNNGAIKGDGTGQTIAIVDAYDQPNIASDLSAFDAAFGLPDPPSFRKVNQTGGSTLPAGDSGWGMEISLDVEWAHAMAPGAGILLVEANSSNFSDLLTAVDYARNQPGVCAVSMSFGGSEFSGENTYDSHFTTPSGHAGVTFCGSSGDDGSASAPEFPSVSPNVLAVGGTALTVNTSNAWSSETGWSGSGGGVSVYEAQPSYQNGVVTQSSTKRTTPDVAYNGADSTPVGVYDTYGNSGWIQVYGTSASAPQWAALIAIANQGRALAGQAALIGNTQTLSKLYKLPSSDFHDISSGSNGGFSASTGYDLVTGLGSPRANLVVLALVDPTGNAPVITTPPTPSGPLGVPFSYSITASNSPTTYATGALPPGLVINTATGAITGTPTSAGSFSIPISATNAIGTGSATLVLTINTSVPVITSAAFATPNPATANTPVSFTAAASGANGAQLTYTWSFGDGANGTGAATTHTYVAAGTYPAGVTVSDGLGNSVSSSVTVVVNPAVPPAPVITSPLSATGTVGTAFSYTITATNAPARYNANGLPPGVLLNTGTGALSGTPTSAGSFTVTLSATNSGGTGSAQLSITINPAASPAPAITGPLTATATVGSFFSYTITATNTPTSFNAGGLPRWAQFDSVSGTISGTPTGTGTYSIALSATNRSGTGAGTLTLTVTSAGAAPVITSSLTASGTVGSPFSYTITALNNPTSFTVFGLPSGLNFDPSSGVISGTPTSAQTSNVTLNATNAIGTDTETLVLTINAQQGGGNGGSIDLGSVPLYARFKLALPIPNGVPWFGVRTFSFDVPAGTRVSGDYLGGRIFQPGVYTFTVTFSTRGTRRTPPVQVQQQYTLTVVDPFGNSQNTRR